jgi:outer membrane cobalamin receptor
LSSRTLLRGAVAFSLAVTASARAQEPVLLDEQVVRLPRATPAGDPLAAATVVEAARFEGEAKGVAELAATAPGVAVADYGGLGQLTTVSIRGSTANGVLVLLDGLPLNTAFGGAVDLSSIPAGWVDRVEVVRGAEGAVYGQGALGGVVNVLTPAPRPGRWSAELAGGSFGSWRADADGAASLGAGRTLLLAATAAGTRGDFAYLFDETPLLPGDPLQPRVRDNNAALRGGVLARLAAPAGPGRLDGLLQLSAGRRGLPGFDRALTPDDWQEDGRLLAALRLAAPGPVQGLWLSGRLHARLDRLDVRIAASGPEPSRQRGMAAGLAGEARWSGRGTVVTATAEAGAEGVRARGLPDTTRGRAALALSADALLAGDRLRIAPAARLDVEGPFAGWSGRLGAALRLAGPWSARAGLGRTFRAPSVAELSLQQGLVIPNPDLVPEIGLGADAALVGDGPAGLASLGAHATRYRDVVIYEASSLGRLKPFNSGEALVTGLEVEAATAPFLGPLAATLSAALTWQRPRLVSGVPAEDGQDVPYRPRERLYARAAVAPGPMALHLEVHHVGQCYRDRRNLDPIPATLVWNAGGSARLRRDPLVALHLEVRNLADDRTLGDGFGNPLPGRMVMVTLRAGSATD